MKLGIGMTPVSRAIIGTAASSARHSAAPRVSFPQNGGAQRARIGSEYHQRVHLPRQADSFDADQRFRGVSPQRLDDGHNRIDPHRRILLAQSRPGMAGGVGELGSSQDALPGIDQDRLRGGRSDIEPEVHRISPRRRHAGDFGAGTLVDVVGSSMTPGEASRAWPLAHWRGSGVNSSTGWPAP